MDSTLSGQRYKCATNGEKFRLLLKWQNDVLVTKWKQKYEEVISSPCQRNLQRIKFLVQSSTQNWFTFLPITEKYLNRPYNNSIVWKNAQE